jgi:LemA protein
MVEIEYAVFGASLCFLLLIGLMILLWAWSTYNRLTGLALTVGKDWGQIDVLLQERFDLIPNLQGIVEGYTSVGNPNMAKIGDSNMLVAAATMSLRAVAEQYPELKADSQYLKFMNTLTKMEDNIADRREFYNEMVLNYNFAIASIPAIIIARLMGLTSKEFFRVTDKTVREAPRVKFN